MLELKFPIFSDAVTCLLGHNDIKSSQPILLKYFTSRSVVVNAADSKPSLSSGGCHNISTSQISLAPGSIKHGKKKYQCNVDDDEDIKSCPDGMAWVAKTTAFCKMLSRFPLFYSLRKTSQSKTT
jgi:hypothetical protein